ncbi:hypothetical protein DBV15_10593 [Temnothorax longispinosus]|uniref:Uncharacterized protein n=1 Tax=Temnothorax longispinosus TaxID=300112 RepID=A0A4S2JRH1_9HYME|nr:hypothetical protein DBV15_10593 [Temnothorax longispinosus]
MRNDEVFSDADSTIETIVKNLKSVNSWYTIVHTLHIYTIIYCYKTYPAFLLCKNQAKNRDENRLYVFGTSELHRLLATEKKNFNQQDQQSRINRKIFCRDITMTQACRERVYFCAGRSQYPVEQNVKNVYSNLKCPSLVDVPLIDEFQVDWLPQDEQTLAALREAGASIFQ